MEKNLAAFWVLLLCFSVFTGLRETASAATIHEVTEFYSGSPVSMSVISLLDVPPEKGTVPVRILVKNDDVKSVRYEVTFNLHGSRVNKASLVVNIEVPAKSEFSQDYVLPNLITSGGGAFVGFSVEGDYLPSLGNSNYSRYNLFSQTLGNLNTPFIGMGRVAWAGYRDKIVEAISPQKSKQAHISNEKVLNGSLLEPAFMPESPGGLEGLDHYIITQEDWNELKPEQQKAVKAWLFAGGNLHLLASDVSLLHLANLKTSSENWYLYGLGEVRRYDPNTTALDYSFLSTRQNGVPDFQQNTVQRRFISDDYTKSLGFSRIVFWGLLPLYAILAGPVNLFYFSRSGKRHRLFWTVPLIAILTTTVLVVYIFLSDGLGGKGKRHGILLLDPEAQMSFTNQTEATRTGLLLSSAFTTDPAVMVTKAVPLEWHRNHNFEVKTSIRGNESFHEGKWYENRALQELKVSAWQPKRGAYQITEDGTFISSSSETLKTGYVFWKGKAWQIENLMPGEKVKLKEANLNKSLQWLRSEMGSGTASYSVNLEALMQQGGWVFALLDHPQKSFIPTLDSIRWEEEKMILISPVSNF